VTDAGLVIVSSLVFLVVGCQEHSSEGSRRPTTVPWTFPGLPDDQERTIDQENPGIDGRLRGIVTITKVRAADYEQYQLQKKAGRVEREERHDGLIYYAIQESRDAGPAMVLITERFKTPATILTRHDSDRLERFRRITLGMSHAAVEASVGKSYKDVGSGIHIWLYELGDGMIGRIGDAGKGVIWADITDDMGRVTERLLPTPPGTTPSASPASKNRTEDQK
jgi:hypothetical protein